MITTTLGLTAAEAAARLAEHGPNELPARPAPGLARRALRQLLDPLALLLLAAATVSILVLGEVREGMAILAIVVLDAAVGAGQEHRADRAMAALRELTAPSARVRRDGVVQHVPAAEVVPGDVVELAAGDRVPADVELVEAVATAVDESLLTGESFPVEKAPAEGALAGTMVVRGRAVGVVVATGTHTELGRLAGGLTAPPPPPLQRELAVVGRVMALLAVGLGALLVPVAAWRGDGDDAFLDALLAGVSLAVAAIPEGLPAAVTASLALGAMRMARRGAIVRRLVAIEALGSTTVLCTDKTGTLTTGSLDVEDVEVLPGREAAFWDAARRCNDAAAGGEDPMDVALLRAASARGAPVSAGTRVGEQPFDAATRTMAVVHETGHGPVLSVKGAPEAVLARCQPSSEVDDLARRATAAAADGRRVLVLADAASDRLDAAGLRPLGLVTFADPLRASAIRAVDACRRAGIRVVLVTGDHPQTAASVARAVGLVDGGTVTGAELAGLPVDERDAALAAAAVVARVDPGIKVDLVAAHRGRGHVVAMTGDGVNDAPALRQADVGVAVAGAAGTDVAREAADLVVTDEDLGTIVEAVREGRRIRRNLAGVVSYLVTGNLSEIAVVSAGVFLLPELAVPLLPVQLLWVNLVTDGLPALALGVDDPPGDLLDEPPRAGGERLLDWRRLVHLATGAVVAASGVLVTALLARRWGWSPEQQRTQLVVTLVLAHLALAYVVRADRLAFGPGSFRNRVLLAAVGGSMALQLAVALVEPLRHWLGLVALPPRAWITAGIAVLATVAVLDALRFVSTRQGPKALLRGVDGADTGIETRRCSP